MITFFDFDFCGMGWRAYDLAIVRWSEGFYKQDFDSFMQRTVRLLQEWEASQFK